MVFQGGTRLPNVREWRCFGTALAVGLWMLASVAPVAAQAPREEPRLALVIGNSAYRESPLRNPVNDVRAMAERSGSWASPCSPTRTPPSARWSRRSRVRPAPRRRRRRRLLLRRPRPASPRTQLPGAGRRRDRRRGIHARRRRRRGAAARADDRGKEPGQPGDPRRLPQQPLRAADARRVPGARRGRRGPGDAGGLRHRAGVGRGGRGWQERAVHRGAAGGAARPGLKIEEVFKRVRINVARRSKGAQTPWESSSLTGDLVVNGTGNVTTAAVSAPTAAGPIARACSGCRSRTAPIPQRSRRISSIPRGHVLGARPPAAGQRRAAGPGADLGFDGTWKRHGRMPEHRTPRLHIRLLAQVKEGHWRGSRRRRAAELSKAQREDTAGRQGQPRSPRHGGRSAEHRQPAGAGRPLRLSSRRLFDGTRGIGNTDELRPCSLTFVSRRRAAAPKGLTCGQTNGVSGACVR